MSGQAVLVVLSVGLFAGWLVHLISQGTGLPLTGALLIGALGAIAGAFLIPYAGLNPGPGSVAVAMNGGMGAALLLLVFKLVRPDDDRKPLRHHERKR
jgi:uncharacterized membrane protein YeaQ/YmgE (transglycosylase-associated protein family)